MINLAEQLKIGVVGPCASGKTTLIAGLNQHGYWGKHIAQEHSYIPDMWSRLTRPDVLIYLDVSYLVSLQRRDMNWTEKEFQEQVFRLRDAHDKADLVVPTDPLTPQQVLDRVLDYLENEVGRR